MSSRNKKRVSPTPIFLDKTKRIIMMLGFKFDSKCAVCHEPQTDEKPMGFHHKWYLNEGEVRYSEYRKAGKSRFDYYSDLEPLILKEPKRFALLCNKCHQAITKICRFKGDKKIRLLRLAEESE